MPLSDPISMQFFTNVDYVQTVQHWESKKGPKIAAWIDSSIFLLYPRAKTPEFERNINSIDLFSKRVGEVAMAQESDHFAAMEDNLFHEKFRMKEHELIKSIAQMDEMLVALPKDRKHEAAVIQTGNELMMELLFDLKRLQIISDDNLSRFLNTENEGQVMFTYAVNKLPHETTREFLNLCWTLMETLAEGPQGKELEALLKFQSMF
jgi:hypothetical protein